MECRSMIDRAFDNYSMENDSKLSGFPEKYKTIKFVLERFNGEIMLPEYARERIDTIIRNIFSGKNECGTLSDAIENGKGEFFYNCIAPCIAVYESELQTMRDQRDSALKENENKRFSLESIASNLDGGNLRATCVDAIEHGIPGRLNSFDKIENNKCGSC